LRYLHFSLHDALPILPVESDSPARLRDALTSVGLEQAQHEAWPDELAGVRAGDRLDLALLCVPPADLYSVLDGLRRYRPRVVVVLAHPTPSEDPVQDMVFCRNWSEQNDSLVLGPRSFGVQRPHLRVNLSHNASSSLPGRVALVTQSRSITAAVLDWAAEVRLGFSTVISLGDEGTIDVAEVLDYLSMDSRTDSIALYLEE